jgi:hypothetical protein
MASRVLGLKPPGFTPLPLQGNRPLSIGDWRLAIDGEFFNFQSSIINHQSSIINHPPPFPRNHTGLVPLVADWCAFVA